MKSPTAWWVSRLRWQSFRAARRTCSRWNSASASIWLVRRESIGDLVPARIAVGSIENDRSSDTFLLMAGAGLDAMIVYNIDAKLKALIGKVAYWVGGFGQFGRSLPEFNVRTNGEEVRCSFALASRVKNYGGDLWIARNASLYRNDFELVLFQGAHSLPYMKYLVGVITGRLAKMDGIKIAAHRNRRDRFFESDPGSTFRSMASSLVACRQS